MFKSERVLLRPMRREDIPRQHAFWQDVELYGLDSEVPGPASIESVESFYESRVKPNDDMVSFAIEADGQYIGYCTLMGLGNPHGNAELGIMIGDRDYWGRGYGREVVNLLLHYAFHYRGLRRVALTTTARNERAIRCYLACGFVEEGRPRQVLWIEGAYVDLVDMSILRDEWQSRREGSHDGTALRSDAP